MNQPVGMRTSDSTMVSQPGLPLPPREAAIGAAPQALALLQQLDRDMEAVVLSRQHPLTGLLPASTANTVHGNYGDAWVRDCVYSIQCVWGLAWPTGARAAPAAGLLSWSSGCCS